ncbi:MAG: xylulose kinase [Ignavibacteriales bacterium]|nr:xylulose kinase [Ignavibacteriales bacterium]
MNNNLVIGLDSSTTSTKAIVFDKNGKIYAKASSPIPLFSPQLNYYEQNPEDWWKSAKIVLNKITKQIDPNRIKALSIVNQRETFVPLDKNQKPLRSAIIWLDERCKSEVEPFAKLIGKANIHKITGKPIDYAPVVYRLAWMKKYEKDLYKKIAMICDVQAWLVWKLTGEFKTSWASADPLGLFDMKKKKWSNDILGHLELNENQLPLLYPTGKCLGKISKEAAKSTCLKTETKLIAGGGDGQAAGLGSNAISSERAYLNLGTAAVAGIYGKQYKTNNAFRTMSACNDNGYYYECSLRAGTFAIDWFIKNIINVNTSQEPKIYKQLENEAKKVSLGSDELLFLPYLNGVMNPYWDSNARSVFLGLSSFHTRGHMYRSILEGIAFEQLFAIEEVEKITGKKVKQLAAIGGGASSIFWCKIIADITNKDLLILKNSEASCLGAGISATVGLGLHSSFKSAADKMNSVKKTITPDQSNHKKYKKMFARYKNIYPSIQKVFQLS